MKVKATPLSYQWIKRQTVRLVNRAERWVCPHPERLLGLQPALIDGPGYGRAHIHFMESTGSAGSTKKITASQDELLGLLKKKKYKDLALVSEAFDQFDALSKDLQERNLQICFQLVEWQASTEVMAAALLIGLKPSAVKNKALACTLENREKLNNFNCLYAEEGARENLGDLLYLTAKSHGVLLMLAAEDLIELKHFSKEDVGIRHRARRAFFITSGILKYLGFEKDGCQLEDMAFLRLEPVEYKDVELYLREHVAGGMDKITALERLRSIMSEIDLLLDITNMPHKLKYRTKGIVSAKRKMEEKGEAVDSNGAMIVLDSNIPEDCYVVLRELREHFKLSQWQEISDRFDDYIALPKPKTHYQSIHVYFKDPAGYIIEIQIRTQEMDDVAEFGTASHAAYKFCLDSAQINGSLPISEQRFGAKVAELEKAGTRIVYNEYGYLVKLLTGSSTRLPTLLDFAFAEDIFTGLYTEGGNVNGKRVALEHTLESGTIVSLTRRKPGERGMQVRGRAKKVNTPFATTVLLAASRGDLDLSISKSLEQLKGRGAEVNNRLIASLDRDTGMLSKLFKIKPNIFFSHSQLLGSKGFANIDEYYTTLALLRADNPFLGELVKYIMNHLVMLSVRPQGKTADLELLALNQRGVFIALLNLLDRHDLKLRSFEQHDVKGTPYSFMRFNVGVTTSGLTDFSREVKDLYAKIPPLTPQYGKVISLSTRVDKATAPESLAEILDTISGFNGNIRDCSLPLAQPKEDLYYSFSIQLPPRIRIKKVVAKIEGSLKKIRGIRGIIITQ